MISETIDERAGVAVDSIISDLSDRRGIKHAWWEIDEETQGEIKQVWRAKVIEAIVVWGFKNPPKSDAILTEIRDYLNDMSDDDLEDGQSVLDAVVEMRGLISKTMQHEIALEEEVKRLGGDRLVGTRLSSNPQEAQRLRDILTDRINREMEGRELTPREIALLLVDDYHKRQDVHRLLCRELPEDVHPYREAEQIRKAMETLRDELLEDGDCAMDHQADIARRIDMALESIDARDSLAFVSKDDHD